MKIEYPTITRSEAERMDEADAVRQEQIRRLRAAGKIVNWYLEER